jgi:flagellar hook-associated protein 3 FlgL
MSVTFGSLFRSAASDISKAADALSDAQQAVSSGRRFQGPGDDPQAALAAIRERSEIATLDSYVEAADSGESRLMVVDGVLNDLVSQVSRAQVAVISALGAPRTPVEIEASAVELEGIRDALFTDLTTTFRGSYLFSGASVSTAPYTKNAAGIVSAYLGSTATTNIDVNRQTAVKVSFDGDVLTRGSGVNDVFVVMTNLITAIRAGNSVAVESGLQELGVVFNQVTASQSGVGADLRQIDEQRARVSSLRVAGLGRLSKHETVDTVEAVLGLQAANKAYESALTAVGARSQLSLMDFLR